MERQIRGVLFVVGFIAMTVGFAGAWWPLGCIVPGAVLCSLVILSARTLPKQPGGEND